MSESQLARLAAPIDPRFVEKKPGGFDADYVSHPVIVQYLIGILRRVQTQEIVREIYDDGKLTGVVLRLTLVIDGERVVIEEAGDDDGTAKNNGARLKNAVSDAYKRCAMRATVGLHLWAQEHYFLHASLTRGSESERPQPASAADGEQPAAPNEEPSTGEVATASGAVGGPEPDGASVPAPSRYTTGAQRVNHIAGLIESKRTTQQAVDAAMKRIAPGKRTLPALSEEQYAALLDELAGANPFDEPAEAAS